MCQKCQAKANANTYYPQPNRGFQAPPSGAIPRQMPSSAPTNKQVDPPAPAHLKEQLKIKILFVFQLPNIMLLLINLIILIGMDMVILEM